MKHTEGTWTVETTKIGEYRVQSSDKIICWTGFTERPSELSHEERLANAQLIANAPIYFAALQRIAVEGKREDGRYDKHDARGFVRIAEDATKA